MISVEVKKKLELVEKEAQKYYETIYASVSKAEISNFKSWWANTCSNLILPSEYLDIISMIDGFDFDGLSFYSISKGKNNIYESNEIYWENENLREYLFIGESSVSWYGISFNTNKYYVLDKPSCSIINEFLEFDGLILEALESIL